MKRRDFIRNIGLVGLGALFAPSILTQAVAEGASLGSSDLAGINLTRGYFNFGGLERRLSTDAIVIHHVGTSADADTSAATIHKIHQQNGWSGIGYHFVVRKDGTIEEGRPLDMIGAHCYGDNDHTVGICFAGNFEISSPTDSQLIAGKKLVAALCERYKLSPNENSVYGHCDLVATCCPGHNLYNDISGVIESAGGLYTGNRKSSSERESSAHKTSILYANKKQQENNTQLVATAERIRKRIAFDEWSKR